MMEKQIKNLAWNTFKKTGNIDTFMEFMKVENICEMEKSKELKDVEGIRYGNNQD